jgi:hypothetical protein
MKEENIMSTTFNPDTDSFLLPADASRVQAILDRKVLFRRLLIEKPLDPHYYNRIIFLEYDDEDQCDTVREIIEIVDKPSVEAKAIVIMKAWLNGTKHSDINWHPNWEH